MITTTKVAHNFSAGGRDWSKLLLRKAISGT